MSGLIVTASVIFGTVAAFAGLLLYVIKKKFVVEPDIKAEKIAEVLPQANCGACGKAGCAAFAKACANASAEEFSSLYCPVGGAEVMAQISEIMGFAAVKKNKQFAVVHCQGTCEKAPKKFEYDGVKSCRLQNMLFVGENGCPNGCIHSGDCVKACKFDAIHIDEKTKLPQVDIKKCVACGACVKACPRALIELKSFNENGKLLYVACKNLQTGAQAMKNCKAACIACSKCAKMSVAMLVENNLARVIDEKTATVCGEDLVGICPNKVIVLKKEEDINAKK